MAALVTETSISVQNLQQGDRPGADASRAALLTQLPDERLAKLRALVQPMALRTEHGYEVLEPLQSLLPTGLPRGATVAVDGSLALAFAVAAGASQAGSWVCLLGLGVPGLAAAREMGVQLERVVVVDADGQDDSSASWTAMVAAAIDAVDVVIARPPRLVRAADARRLAGRLRERGAVLVLDGRDRSQVLTVDRMIRVVDAQWCGLGVGHGVLTGRRLVAEATGRAAAARPRRCALHLPDRDGGVSAAEVTVVGGQVHELVDRSLPAHRAVS
jgi:hypothetical protein